MKAMMKKVSDYFKAINLATKVLILIGIFCLLETAISIFYFADQSSPNAVAIRSVMSSIFGFIFGAQLTENSNINNRYIQTVTASSVAIICLLALTIAHFTGINQIGAASVEVRNLMFSAIGFLISRAKSLD